MPQFDFSVYFAQIFWFGICFTALYLSAHFVILPRLKEIIRSRNLLIDSDLTTSRQLNLQIEEIEQKIHEIRSSSANSYQASIDAAVKQSAKNREESIELLKSKLDDAMKTSRADMEKYVTNSLARSEESIQDLVLALKNKILN